MLTCCEKILILSSEASYNATLKAALEKAGMLVESISNQREYLKTKSAITPRAIVMRVSVVEGWSFDLINEVRSLFANVPLFLTSDILMINSRATQSLQVEGFFFLPDEMEALVKQLALTRNKACKVS